MAFYDIFQLAALGFFLVVVASRAISVRLKSRHNPIKLSVKRNSIQHAAALILFVAVNLWAAEILRSVLRPAWQPLPAIAYRRCVDGPIAKSIGVALTAVGFGVFVVALKQLGLSWRLGIDEQTPGELITSGIYALSRNPIYVFFDLYFLGTFLVNGTPLFLAALVLLSANLHIQIQQEEKFLIARFGAAYEAYAARVGRYVVLPDLRIRRAAWDQERLP